MKRFVALFLVTAMLLSLCACGAPAQDDTPSVTTTTTTATSTVPPITIPTAVGDGQPVTATLCGVNMAEYTIVYDDEAPDYTVRAALYIRDAILARTGAALAIVSDDVETGNQHEIVVGETNRPISATLDAKTEGLQFAYMAADGHVALEADYFVIAAAAYYFAVALVEKGQTDAAKQLLNAALATKPPLQ